MKLALSLPVSKISSISSFVLASFCLVSCSNMNQQVTKPTLENDALASTLELSNQNETTVLADANAQLALPVPQALYTRSLVEKTNGSLGLDYEKGSDYSKLIISADQADPKYKVSSLKNPSRLVIDFPNTKGQASKAFQITDSPAMVGVRLGAHTDMQRLVVDLSDKTTAKPNVDLVDGKINISFAESSVATETAQEATTAKLSVEPATPTPVLKVAEQIAEPVKNTPMVTNIKLEQLDGSNNMLVTDVSSNGYFALKKTAPSEFVLTLQDASIEPAAMNTLVSAPSSGVIRSVRPVVQGKDLLLRIFAKDGSDLMTKTSDGKILVLAKKDLNDSGPYAQLKPEEPAKADTVAKDAGEVSETEVEKTGTEANLEGSGELASEDSLAALLEPEKKYSGRLISLDLQETDIDNALRIIAEVSNLNIIASDDVTGKVTLRLIDVPWDQALDVILKTNGLDKVQEGNVIRIAPVEKLRAEREALKEAQRAEEELEPLVVRYVRVSYAKATEVQPLIETVLSERGGVTTDERTNQLIIKDIRKGINNAVELVRKLDLRTPQVLLETQIVEANRNFLRDLGSSLGFNYARTPELGNATGQNFPNSIELGGALDGLNNGSSFLGSGFSPTEGSAVSLLLGSADGSRSLNAQLASLEREGRGRVVSKPSVATVNNKQATIKSVTKIRVKLPQGGSTLVNTGSGGSNSGSSAATEVIEAGITLNVTPQASPDYFVLLDINAKSSTVNFEQRVDTIPTEIERSATSTVLVSSGQTFALGGIYKVTEADSNIGVPFLKDIPVFGTFFRNTLVRQEDEELIFFITPRIVEGSFDDAAMKSAF